MDKNKAVKDTQGYQLFLGNYVDAISKLRADGRVPLTVKQIAEKRLKIIDYHEKDKLEYLFLRSFDTSDASVHFGEEIKIVPNCEILKKIDSSVNVDNGYLDLTEKQYNSLDGKVFQFNEIPTGELFTEQEVKEHPLWQVELGDLLEPYAEMIFRYGRQIFSFKKAMRIHISSIPSVSPILRPFSIYGVDDRSSIDSKYYCFSESTRFIGGLEEKVIKNDRKRQ